VGVGSVGMESVISLYTTALPLGIVAGWRRRIYSGEGYQGWN
jgi:hypothetical protein